MNVWKITDSSSKLIIDSLQTAIVNASMVSSLKYIHPHFVSDNGPV